MIEEKNPSFIEKYHLLFLGLLLTLSLVVKIIYVFYYTDYTNYLGSDMGGYWDRALNSFHGNDHGHGQWAVWPPFAHITLAWFFKFLYFFGYFDQKLELAMVANIVMSTFSILWIYLIALKLYPSKGYALLTSTVYAFFFPLIYLNAFILSEHLSMFTFLFAIVLLLYAKKSWVEYFIVGVLLSFTIGIRPSFGIAGLPFFIYILFQKRGEGWWKSLKYMIVFSVGYVVFLLFIVINNNADSEGKMNSLAASGGLNFYLSSCQVHGVITKHGGYEWDIFPPSVADQPELGIAYETEPFYHQAYYYTKGWECFNKSNITLMERLSRYKYLYFGAMFPITGSALFASKGIPFFGLIAFFMTLFLLLSPLLFLSPKISSSVLIFLLGIIATQFLVLFFYNIEQRYMYGFFFVIVLLSILVPIIFLREFQNYSMKIYLYTIMIIFLIGFVIFRSITYGKLETKYVDPQIRAITMQLYQNKQEITTVDQERNVSKQKQMMINKIHFKYINNDLVHVDLGKIMYRNNFFADFNISMHILQEGSYRFLIISDDGFILDIDQAELCAHRKDRPAKMNVCKKEIKKGKHTYSLRYFQGGGDMELRAYYEIDKHRYFIGEDSKYIHFLPNVPIQE